MKISQRLKFDLPEVKTIAEASVTRQGMGGWKENTDLIHFILLTSNFIFLGGTVYHCQNVFEQNGRPLM